MIERYIRGELSPEEVEELWMGFLRDMKHFKTYIELEKQANKYE